MDKYRSVFSYVAAGLVVFALILVVGMHIYKVPYIPIESGQNKQESLSPIGEIMKGHLFVQPIEIPGDLLDKPRAYVGVFFATYMRRNSGSIRITLSQGDQAVSRTYRVSKFRDNSYVYLQFDPEVFHAGKAKLFIEGIDGEVGSSVTAWARPLNEETSLAHNGVPLNFELKTPFFWRIMPYSYLEHLAPGNYGAQILFVLVFLIPAGVALGVGVYSGVRETKPTQ